MFKGFFLHNGASGTFYLQVFMKLAWKQLGLVRNLHNDRSSLKLSSYCLLSQPTPATDCVSSCSLDVDAKMELEVQGIYRGRHL